MDRGSAEMPQAETVAVPKRFPLVAMPENRDDSTAKDAKLINGYQETNSETKEIWVYKRPGLLQTGATKVGNGYGVWNWNNDIYAIFGTTLYKNGTGIGTVNGAGGVYRWSSSLGSTPRLQLGNAVAAYNWDNATLTQISGANFPGNTYVTPAVKGIVYLDGSTYVMDTGAYIHGCDTPAGLNRPDLWTDTTNILGAQIEPDSGKFLAKQLVYVLAMKQWSTEVFYNAQNAPGSSPLSPVQGAKMNYGCASADSVQEIDGALIWLATNRASAIQVVQSDNLKAVPVSTKPIERLLSTADLSTVYSWSCRLEGHQFYVVTIVAENLTLAYDLVERRWSQWTDTDGNYLPIVASTFSSDFGRILQHATNGKLYLFDSNYVNDDGSRITVDIITPNFDGGVRRRKQVNSLEFIGDQVAGSTLQVRHNDSDYDPTKWSNFRNVSLGEKKPVLMNCGTFMRRAMHLRHQSNTRFRIQALEMAVDLGTL